MTNKTKFHEYDLNLTTSIPVDLAKRFKEATKTAGLTQSQALILSITFHYAAPAATGDLGSIPEPITVEGTRPESPNIHARVPGIVGFWFEEIVRTLQDRRYSKGEPLPVTKTEVLGGIITNFCDLVEGGKL